MASLLAATELVVASMRESLPFLSLPFWSPFFFGEGVLLPVVLLPLIVSLGACCAVVELLLALDGRGEWPCVVGEGDPLPGGDTWLLLRSNFFGSLFHLIDRKCLP